MHTSEHTNTIQRGQQVPSKGGGVGGILSAETLTLYSAEMHGGVSFKKRELSLGGEWLSDSGLAPQA